MNTIQICNQEIQVKEYNGERVITFKDIDRVHERPESTARQNFNRNKKHFIERKDFYKISSYEIHTMGIEAKSNLPNGLILITESGYLMLVKSFTDDLAWRVQRELVNCYFKVQEIKEAIVATVTETDKLTTGDWLRLIDAISNCPKHNHKMLLAALNKFLPGYFREAEIEKETTVKIEVPENIKELITNYMDETILNQSEVAKVLGVSKSVLHYWKNGKYEPREETKQKNN